MFKTIENKTINEILNFSLIEVDKYQLKISTVIVLSVFILFIIVFLKFLKKLINRSTKFDQGKKYSIFNLFKYFTLVFTIVFSLQIIGLDVSVLLAGSAALLVGIGFGLQNVFSDFISGIIILVDASVKVNDVIELNGLIGSVIEINFRTTTVMTRDEKYIIIPNSQLTSSQLINWSHSKITSRFEVSVGVDYSSDVEKVIQLLEEAVKLHPKVLRTPKPFVRFTEFADSSLNFTILFWSNDLFRIENVKSEIRIEIFKLFKKKESLYKAMIVKQCLTSDVIQLSFEGEDSVIDHTNEEIFKIPHREVPRYIHIDTALKHDTLGFAMTHSAGVRKIKRYHAHTGTYVHLEEPIYKTDLAFGIKAQPGSEIPFFKVREFIVWLRKTLGINIALVSTDGFQSAEFRQLLKKLGFETELISLDRTKEPYFTGKQAIIEERAWFPINNVLLQELKEVEDVGKKIDHPDGGCFVGDTLIELSSGEEVEISELLENESSSKKVKGFDLTKNQLISCNFSNPRITKYVDQIIEIELENGKLIKCTPDHKFLLKSGIYKKACDLQNTDELEDGL